MPTGCSHTTVFHNEEADQLLPLRIETFGRVTVVGFRPADATLTDNVGSLAHKRKKRCQQIPRAVAAAVIDQNNLLGDRHRPNAADNLLQRGPFIVDGHDDGNTPIGWYWIYPKLAAQALAQQLLQRAGRGRSFFWR